ncbi:iron complex transport system substrate-binding protein [Oxalobacteraceae bacterium GrIS 2.11]
MKNLHQLILWISLCASLQSSAAIVARDDAGLTVTLSKPAQRIISLSPAETEILFAAGGGQHVVGVVRYSDYPQAATRIPVVGDALGLDMERIVSLKPDLIVVWYEGNNQQHVEQLRQLGIPLFFGQPHRLDDIPNSVATLGRLMGTEQQANKVAAALRQQLVALKQKYAQRTPVRLFYQVWDQPLYTLNGQHIVSDAIKLCGGVNIFADLKTVSPNVDIESVLRLDPEAIIGTDEKNSTERGVMMWKRYPAMTAVKHQNLFLIDGNLINRAGPRMIAGTAALCDKLDQARAKQ